MHAEMIVKRLGVRRRRAPIFDGSTLSADSIRALCSSSPRMAENVIDWTLAHERDHTCLAAGVTVAGRQYVHSMDAHCLGGGSWLVDGHTLPAGVLQLTDKQAEVVMLLGRGFSPHQIARWIGRRPNAVLNRLYGACRKLDLSPDVLARYAETLDIAGFLAHVRRAPAYAVVADTDRTGDIWPAIEPPTPPAGGGAFDTVG